MDKVSAQKAAAALREVGENYRVLQSKYDELAEKVAAYERRDEVLKVAQMSIEKGVDGRPLPELAQELENLYTGSREQFDKYAGAVQLIVPNMGQRLASLRENFDEGAGEAGGSSSSQNALMNVLLDR
jgi:hypothetical protein